MSDAMTGYESVETAVEGDQDGSVTKKQAAKIRPGEQLRAGVARV